MGFVDLNRCFVVIGKDEEANLDVGRTWGRKSAGWLDWPDLLKCRRVVLLAEASSGKTEEFRHHAETLAAQGKAAFFVPIEELADDGFESALDRSAVSSFENWHSGNNEEDAWFFLDSVDEARLNHKSLGKALRKFAREIDKGLERAHVYISCRVTDWKGQEDRDAVERYLPIWKRPASPNLPNKDEALLAPIFNKQRQSVPSRTDDEPTRDLDALQVVQLVPLDDEQRRALASATGVIQPDKFISEIEKQGLDALAERPGDLLDLAEYWKTKGHFGSLAEMTEHGVSLKLAERDKFRTDNKDLTLEKARQGAERIAAALTLAKSFTLRAPGHEPDPTLATDALDPAVVLDDWTDAERNALLRRGVFAPSTYGRVRFHHRGTQEYLMASWLKRLLSTGCPLNEVWNLLFADLYGVETLVPSLHASAGWLALNYQDIRDEIIRREPLVLLRHGDPQSLPLDAKERLLQTYASRHAKGEISNDSLDHRSLWMFATPDLGKTIRKAWSINDREDFRIDLLRLVREGVIAECADLARKTILHGKANDYLRIGALKALVACDDSKSLASVAQWFLKNVRTTSQRLGSSFSKLLFPQYISVAQLLDVISKVLPPKEFSTGGFSDSILSLWKVCPDPERELFIEGVANLVLAPPFINDHDRISSRHHRLAVNLTQIAIDAVTKLRELEISVGFLRLLMAIERAVPEETVDSEEQLLRKLVSGNSHLQRRLFWADVEEKRQANTKGDGHPIRFWELIFSREPLWQISIKDLDWLFKDFTERPFLSDKRVALSAIYPILVREGNLETELPRLRCLVSATTELQQDLEEYLKPAVDYDKKYRQQAEASRRKREKVEIAAKASWVKFRDELRVNPSVLRDRDYMKSWKAGAFRLYNLSLWLQRRTQKNSAEALLQWRLLEEGFDRPVAEAFRDGMKTLWRVTPPERPVHKSGGGTVVKNTTILSYGGVGIEAAEDPDWALHLSLLESEQAARHGCLSEQGYPGWIEVLADKHPAVVIPVIRQTLHDEWSGRLYGSSDFISHYGWSGNPTPIPEPVQRILLELIFGKKPKDDHLLNAGLRVLRRLNLSPTEKKKVASFALRRLHVAQSGEQENLVLHYLAMLFLVNANAASYELRQWILNSPSGVRDIRAAASFGALWGRDGSGVAVVLREASVPSLEALVRLVYQHVRPEDDKVREGAYTPNSRDNAEHARNVLLTALVNRPGAEAYQSMRTLAADRFFKNREIRFAELARGKAEQDAELPPWIPSEVVAFERQYVAPAKTGDALLRVVMSILAEIQSSFRNADATSRALLQKAASEEEVQEWLAEQLNLRSSGRFHAHREAQVARGDKPDVIVSSTAAQVEVAVEVKHGGKRWTVKDLEKALNKQLVQDYLKPLVRRHGVLVVSHHSERTWRDPDTKESMSFEQLISRLQILSESIVMNDHGAVSSCVFGLDCRQ